MLIPRELVLRAALVAALVVVWLLSVAAVLIWPQAARAQSSTFTDVPAEHPAYEAVEWAAEVGVTVGYGDGTFRPLVILSKSHALIFLDRYRETDCQRLRSADLERLGVPDRLTPRGRAHVLRLVAEHFGPPPDFTRAHMMVLLRDACDARPDQSRDTIPTDTRRPGLKCEPYESGGAGHSVLFWHSHPPGNAYQDDPIHQQQGVGGHPDGNSDAEHGWYHSHAETIEFMDGRCSS